MLFSTANTQDFNFNTILNNFSDISECELAYENAPYQCLPLTGNLIKDIYQIRIQYTSVEKKINQEN